MRRHPVHVIWVDSTTLAGDGWVDVDQPGLPTKNRDLRQETVGYVVRQTKDVLVLGHSRNAATEPNRHSRVMGIVCIPRRAILSITRLRTRA